MARIIAAFLIHLSDRHQGTDTCGYRPQDLLCFAAMTRTTAALAALFISIVLASCAEPSRKYHQDFLVFGTVMGVTLWAGSDEQAQTAFTSLQASFQKMHADWHAWNPGMLTAVNEAFAAGEPAEASADIVEMVRRSQQIETATGGRFNPAIGALVRLWGFHTSEYPVLGPPPSTAEIEALVRQQPSSLDIRLDGLVMESSNPAVQLDFGGIAKGHAIDMACKLLREQGIENGIVNAGGDLRAIGRHADRPWKIAVRSPGGGIIGSLETGADEAVFTSGNYERFRQESEERYPHILDPRTGWPVRDLASVTVIADEGLLADAAATAITVGGLADWIEVARALELDQVMIVDEHGKVFMTRKMAGRMDLQEGVESEVARF
jgi:thiamine biosynthesis lipoprotein